jgi:SpoVK/Ycf46/Vps4 family AAA+-type ATPase
MDKSKRFINYLDNYADKKDISFLGFSSLITSINNDFLNKDPRYLINQKYGKIKLDEKIVKQQENKDYIIKSKKVTITNEINTISDLIEIINTYEYQQDTDYNIDLKSLHNVKKELVLLNSMIGMHQIKESILEQMLYFIQKLDVDKNGDSDFKHTVIYGPPGTGKTEIAKLIGIMYSKLGILKNNVFKKVTRSDLIAGYLGQTAIKTSKIINECIGGVLFIDEAYSLASNENNDSFYK